jgi:hypothetical protein
MFSATTEGPRQHKTCKKQVAMIAQKVIDANQTQRQRGPFISRADSATATLRTLSESHGRKVTGPGAILRRSGHLPPGLCGLRVGGAAPVNQRFYVRFSRFPPSLRQPLPRPDLDKRGHRDSDRRPGDNGL